ncbi:amino acid adenylation domain-containing protein, partial [uncultured Aquimarina sp.]|uniref:non-ribosomal peptide synthetase n=1 Tax=uncultured Aquimarina sp. TaxID=575652 RepID=UPI0026059854
GTTVSGRDLPVEGIESSVGLYINTLPLIVDWSTKGTILAQLHYIQKSLTDLNTHSFVDLAKIQQGANRLFHSLLVFENYPIPQGSEESVANKISLRKVVEKVDYPLSIIAYEQQGALTINLQYDGLYLDQNKANQHIETLKQLVGKVVDSYNTLHSEICLLEKKQYDTIIYDWNATEVAYDIQQTIPALFEKQVLATPNSTALVYNQEQLSYRELNQKSNQLAIEIRKQYKDRTGDDLPSDTLIPLCLDRSFEMIIAILAVLKAGGAYVPMDPEYPQERIDYIIKDTDAKIILTQKHLLNNKVALPEEALLLVDLQQELYTTQDTSNLSPYSKTNNLAYVIYTSGTTGKPKGVMVEHGNTIRLFSVTRDQFNFSMNDVWTMYHSYVFDFSVWELWGALLYSGKLIIPSIDQIKDLHKLYKLCKQYKVTVLNQTPSAFYQFLDVLLNYDYSHFRYIVFGGEALNPMYIRSWWDYKKEKDLNTVLVNMYGITETTVHVTYKELKPQEDTLSNIGKPLSDLKAYVLDNFGTPVPIGVTGELYIGGAGVARGYLNREALTKERFIENPFATDVDIQKGYTRLYKTGDLVRWLEDGNLEYIGRNDDQVKIRGYRIELGEIETALSTINGITQSCVLVKERTTDSGLVKYLVGYYIPEDGFTIDQELIIEQLSTLLPEYMIPSSLVSMDSFPLTINGKLDRKSLPDPEMVDLDSYVAPSTPIQKEFCNIWQEVLGIDTIGITDDFFKTGGDSILSIQASSRIRQLGYPCQVKDIFTYKTIDRLSAYLSSETLNTGIDSEQGVLEGEVSLLPIQRWFTDQIDQGLLPQSGHWNQ